MSQMSEYAFSEIIAFLDQTTVQERQEFFSRLSEFYCLDCGEILDEIDTKKAFLAALRAKQ